MSERNSVWLRDKFQTLQTDVTRGCYRYQISDVANGNVRCCGQLRYVTEIGLVNSAVTGITVEQQQMPTVNSAAGINQTSTNWVWSTQLLMKHSNYVSAILMLFSSWGFLKRLLLPVTPNNEKGGYSVAADILILTKQGEVPAQSLSPEKFVSLLVAGHPKGVEEVDLLILSSQWAGIAQLQMGFKSPKKHFLWGIVEACMCESSTRMSDLLESSRSAVGGG
ncbi:hypothetical protein F511_27239 [Dorcoceras hygrometricum]|uniref:Uncharacterized protein n=1 Tax=Dorcoceras hygrometricum TaxID=472368 RepID=A0A2Z7BME3_9LAMI|nr:hypothetical protein F511_27239 [Dorcoceras hygrometricum]